nr:ribosome assembly cofactor RimP [Bacteroides sp.]
MIDKQLIADTVADAIKDTDAFVVDIRVSRDNDITVELDSPGNLDIDTCAAITRKLNEVLDRDVEDYSLEVGSAGLTAPFKVAGQYLKNVGNRVEVLTRDGRKLKGTLTSVDADASPLSFTVTTQVKEKAPGAKRPVLVDHPETFTTDMVKSVVYLIDFK